METAWDNMKDEIEDELEAVITEAKEGVSKALLHSEEFLKHTDQIFIEIFQNHDFKEWISLKIMLFWLLIQSDNVHFYEFSFCKEWILNY